MSANTQIKSVCWAAALHDTAVMGNDTARIKRLNPGSPFLLSMVVQSETGARDSRAIMAFKARRCEDRKLRE